MRTQAGFGAIVLMGVSGCGKTTVGRLLAADLGCEFLEGDELHDASSIAKMKSGTALTDVERWPWLDRVAGAMQQNCSDGGTVVASCSALKRSYRDRLRRGASAEMSFIFLAVAKSDLELRLSNRSGHYMPASLLASQLTTLERPGSDERALTLDAAAPPEQLSKSIRDWLGRLNDSH